jgi:kumamolisin
VKQIVRGRVLVGLALITAALVTPLAAASGATPPSTANAMTPVAHGVDPSALPGSTVFGTTPPNTPESVSFILQERNEAQLEASVEHGLSQFATVSQFAQLFGQTPANVAQLEHYLAGFGITTYAYPDDVDVSANGTAGEFDKALGVQQFQYNVPAQAGHDGLKAVPAQTVHGPSGSPELPSSIAQYVLAVLGLTNYSPFTSQAIQAPDAKPAAGSPASAPAASNGNTAACLDLSGLPDACHTPTDFESNYGLSSLEQAGHTGQGETLAIVTLAALDPGAPHYFWQNVLGMPATYRTVTVDNVDGGPGAPSNANGSGETDLDVEQSGAIARNANVLVYQAPNTDSGFADAFFDAASQNIASTVSSSWGESETYVAAAVASGAETPAYEEAFDEAFLEFAAQGQSGFLAAGDSGAYDASSDLGTTNLSVDTSSDSPYITSSGGTTLPWSGALTGPDGSAHVAVSAQRAWGWDYTWPAMAAVNGESLTAAAEANVVGGGGGYSTVEPTPSYQVGIAGTGSYSDVEYLTPSDPQNVGGILEPTEWVFNPTPALGHGVGTGRAQPDLSTDADPFSGYLLYQPSFAQADQPALQGGWGGTSFVAPQLNGSAAVIDSLLGHRVGLWNPSIYSFATSSHSPFTPLDQSGTSNDNVFYSGTPGTLYNPATGLGVPNLGVLAADFG